MLATRDVEVRSDEDTGFVVAEVETMLCRDLGGSGINAI